jgi:hypothetical protein
MRNVCWKFWYLQTLLPLDERQRLLESGNFRSSIQLALRTFFIPFFDHVGPQLSFPLGMN